MNQILSVQRKSGNNIKLQRIVLFVTKSFKSQGSNYAWD